MKYPTIADVNAATLTTLLCWHRELSAPQTDVECTVRRRIKRRIAALHLRENNRDSEQTRS